MLNKSTNIKGFIAEEICKFHLNRAGFNIINSGKEWFDKDLADKLTQQKPANGNHTLNIFNNIIAKLPDFMIWRNSDKQKDIEYKFVEVKYRKTLDAKVFISSTDRSGYPYLKYTCKDATNDSLQVFKYMQNLENLMSLENSSLDDLAKIEFYIYLITSDDLNNNTNILFGKVFGSKAKGYSIYFYAPNEVSVKFGNVWTNYLNVADYLLEHKKIDSLYAKESLYIHEEYEFLQKHIKNVILN